MTSSASSSLPSKSDFLDTSVTAVTHQPMLSYALSLTAGILPYGAVLMGNQVDSALEIKGPGPSLPSSVECLNFPETIQQSTAVSQGGRTAYVELTSFWVSTEACVCQLNVTKDSQEPIHRKV